MSFLIIQIHGVLELYPVAPWWSMVKSSSRAGPHRGYVGTCRFLELIWDIAEYVWVERIPSKDMFVLLYSNVKGKIIFKIIGSRPEGLSKHTNYVYDLQQVT